jgi:hypothetical protein
MGTQDISLLERGIQNITMHGLEHISLVIFITLTEGV